MQRVVIIGGPGSGKSTLAQQLGATLDLPAYHLDRYFWKPGWVMSMLDEFAERVRVVAEQDRWVIDGNYSLTLPDRLARADTVIFLDLPRRIRLWRVLKRRVQHHGQTRPDMGEGCPEQIDWVFFKHVMRYHRDGRLRALALIDELRESEMRVVHLRSPGEVRMFLENLQSGVAVTHQSASSR